MFLARLRVQYIYGLKSIVVNNEKGSLENVSGKFQPLCDSGCTHFVRGNFFGDFFPLTNKKNVGCLSLKIPLR